MPQPIKVGDWVVPYSLIGKSSAFGEVVEIDGDWARILSSGIFYWKKTEQIVRVMPTESPRVTGRDD